MFKNCQKQTNDIISYQLDSFDFTKRSHILRKKYVNRGILQLI